MFANVDRRSLLLARLTVVAFWLQGSVLDTAYSQHAARDQLKPLDVANACLARGDNVCVVRALEGKAKSVMELGLLVETYRALEEPEYARAAMEQYVQRFPDAPRTSAYRRMLETMPQSTSAQSPSAQSTTPAASAQTPAPKGASATSSTSTSTNTSAQSRPPAATSQTRVPLEEANACRAADDDHCIVRALEGKAQTAEELGMLCEAYRELGDNKRARAAMQQYIELFPKGSFSPFYREQLNRTR
jgi:hypothetical protein